MLQKVGGLGPIGCESHEPDHLLSTPKIVDDGSGGRRGKGAGGVGCEHGNGLSDGCIGDDCREVPETLCADGGTPMLRVSWYCPLYPPV